MTVRAINKEDIAEVAEIYMSAYNKIPWNYNWRLEDAIIYLKEYFDCPQFVGFVLMEGNEVAAALFAHKKTWWTGNQLFIDELFVNSEKQGLGYGRVLMQHAEKYCSQNDLKMITLMTNKFMPALKYYESIEYMKVDPYVFMFKQL